MVVWRRLFGITALWHGLCDSTSSCSAVLVRDMMGTVSEVSKFFEHGKRQDKLEEVIESEMPEVRKKRVKPLCRTRWVERHDFLEIIVELYPAIIGALSDIAYGKHFCNLEQRNCKG